jgi:hypothetical protein
VCSIFCLLDFQDRISFLIVFLFSLIRTFCPRIYFPPDFAAECKNHQCKKYKIRNDGHALGAKEVLVSNEDPNHLEISSAGLFAMGTVTIFCLLAAI